MNRDATIGGFIAMLLGAFFITRSLNPVNYANAVIGLSLLVGGFVVFGRSVVKGASSHKLQVGYDFVAIPLVAIYFLVIVFGGLGGLIGHDVQSFHIAVFLIMMGLVGIVMSMVTGTFSISSIASKMAFNQQLFWIAGSFVMFFILNAVVPPTLPIFFKQSLADSEDFVTVIISIPEEILFRGWLTPWLGNVSRLGMMGGALGGAFIGMVYHFFIFGTQPEALIIVFLAFFVQGLAALKTKRLGTTISTHLGNNLFSVARNLTA